MRGRLGPAAADRAALERRGTGSGKVHKYEGWAWAETAPDTSPDWMPDEITGANVSKEGIEHLAE